MALNCPVNVVYHTSPQQRIRTKEAARRYKFGSPKIRDILREKCRVRVREARRASFDNARGVKGNESIGSNEALIKKILREEVAELEEDLKLQELIYEEMMEEVNEWFIEEYEKQENYLLEVENDKEVFCPVCQRHCLKQQQANKFTCNCGISFSYRDGLEVFRDNIQAILAEHEQKCSQELTFFTEPGANNDKKLSALCQTCDYFYNFSVFD